MIKLKLFKNKEYTLNDASLYFSKEYLADLKDFKPNTFDDSLVSRHIVSKLAREEFRIESYIPAVDFEEEEFEEFTYSISHKDGNIFVGVSDDFIGLDIEKYKERDESVFEYFTDNEWKTLGGINFSNFYIGWTAKESLIKFLELGIDDIKNIKIHSIKKEPNTIGDIGFQYVVILLFEENYFKVFSGISEENKIFFSLASNL